MRGRRRRGRRAVSWAFGRLTGERDGDGAGAGAYVNDAEGFAGLIARAESVECGFDEMLGEVAGDEDGGCDAHGKARRTRARR